MCDVGWCGESVCFVRRRLVVVGRAEGIVIKNSRNGGCVCVPSPLCEEVDDEMDRVRERESIVERTKFYFQIQK